MAVLDNHSWQYAQAGRTLIRLSGFHRNEDMKAIDVLPILKEKVAFLSGGRDRRGGPVLTFPARSNHDRIRPEDLRRLVAYLATIPR
ncbi:triple functional domain protein-like isoform X2 [Betta splendens]|uniref:Triple functional domain protein-like isoform X2 n=1 Tax=Betta splendens TaxID=158456 RepID=A0A8M1H5Q0_BETSP|nr:triple functional domain protein-like isoform X2 [Betta splendens]